MSSIDLSNMAREMQRILDGYTSTITADTMKVVEEVGKETVEELKRTSPSGNRKKNKYKKSWKLKKEKGHVIVHNTQYQLTHLLEKGHLRRNGRFGTKPPLTRPYPHIKPAEMEAVRKLQAGIESVIRNT